MRHDLESLVPELFNIATRIVSRANAEIAYDVRCIVTITFRSTDEQDALYAQGRTAPGAIVTAARGGSSYHECGRAFDVMLLRSGKPINSILDPAWEVFGRIVDEEGACWGGHWKNPDGCHVEYHPAATCRDAARFIQAKPRSVEMA